MRDDTQIKLVLLFAVLAAYGNTLEFIIADRVYLRNQNLTTVPSDSIPEENARAVTRAIFSHNNFNVLKISDFVHLSQFPNLKYVFFDHNNISDIEGDTFIHLPKMKFLDLSHNRLSGISSEFYDDLVKLASLQYINLKRNPIKKFKNIDKLAAKGIQVEYDGVLGREKKLKMRNRRVVSDGPPIYNDSEDIDKEDADFKQEEIDRSEEYQNEIDDEKNYTVVDKPIKAYVVDHKLDQTNINKVKNNFMGSIIFNFLAAFLVLVALPVAMIIYYFIHRNDGIS